VEFLSTYYIKVKIIYAKVGKKIVAIDEHLIINVFKISNKGWKKTEACKQTNYKNHASTYCFAKNICENKIMECGKC
jgi:hypothetical protein